jgi:hypothetical protein
MFSGGWKVKSFSNLNGRESRKGWMAVREGCCVVDVFIEKLDLVEAVEEEGDGMVEEGRD